VRYTSSWKNHTVYVDDQEVIKQSKSSGVFKKKSTKPFTYTFRTSTGETATLIDDLHNNVVLLPGEQESTLLNKESRQTSAPSNVARNTESVTYQTNAGRIIEAHRRPIHEIAESEPAGFYGGPKSVSDVQPLDLSHSQYTTGVGGALTSISELEGGGVSGLDMTPVSKARETTPGSVTKTYDFEFEVALICNGQPAGLTTRIVPRGLLVEDVDSRNSLVAEWNHMRSMRRDTGINFDDNSTSRCVSVGDIVIEVDEMTNRDDMARRLQEAASSQGVVVLRIIRLLSRKNE